MEYSRKLFIAKILITLGTFLYTFVPLFVDMGDGHMASNVWSMHDRFHMVWLLSVNVIAFPVLLYVLWGKLHGTGRSARLVAFLGMAYTAGFFVANTLHAKIWSAAHGEGHRHLLIFIKENFVFNMVIFALLTLGVLFSIKRDKTAK